MSVIYPIILCGGVGTRLWPLSRAHQPKQFQPIDADGTTTFFQTTVQRHSNELFGNPVVCVARGHLETVRRQLRDIQSTGRIIAEPVSRNTGPAVLAAALELQRTNPDSLMLICPSDHVIGGDINGKVRQVRQAAMDGLILTLGIKPRYAETGYGYIMDGGEYHNYTGVHRAERFVEKPDLITATNLISTGFAYWASGISMFRADVLIEEYRAHDPQTFAAVTAALKNAERMANETIIGSGDYENAVELPTERAIFEKSKRMALAPAPVDWDDVGAWAAFHTIGKKTDDGNVVSGDVIMINSENSYVRGSNRLVAVVGMQDVIVVDTHDALLVTTREKSQDVKKVVEMLQARKRQEAVDHSVGHTDWGQHGKLISGAGFTLRHLTVNPGAILPIELGVDMRRLMVVASGAGTLQIGDLQRAVRAGTSFEVGVEQTGTVVNDGATAMQVIEVACHVDGPLTLLTPLVELAVVAAESRAHA